MEGRIYRGLRHLIAQRKACPAFAGNRMEVIDVGNDHVFGFVRTNVDADGEARVLVLANFSEHVQPIEANELRLYGLGYAFIDMISGDVKMISQKNLALEPYQVLWLGIHPAEAR